MTFRRTHERRDRTPDGGWGFGEYQADRDPGIAPDRGWRPRYRDERSCRPESQCRSVRCPWRRDGFPVGWSFPCAEILRSLCRLARDAARDRVWPRDAAAKD